eukprot:1158497-Pelagomonas_calceolata.AAC.2
MLGVEFRPGSHQCSSRQIHGLLSLEQLERLPPHRLESLQDSKLRPSDMYIQVEEVTLPIRFIVFTGHFIAVLAVVFDFDRIVSCITEIDPTKATGSALDSFEESKQQ